LIDVNEEEAVGQVLGVIRTLRPQVLLTWPPDGLSGHPDHVAVSRWTTQAFHRAAGPGPNAPAALYHLAVPCSVAQALGLAQLHAVPDEDVTVAVDVTPVWAQEMAAIRCHRAQLDDPPILKAPAERQRLFLDREHFCRAEARQLRDFSLNLKEKQWPTQSRSRA
jgi:N-acetyl-1-D-myo-inositol-2-amino-2-deoxy-alpha-D-glucopyranoside deacetylase